MTEIKTLQKTPLHLLRSLARYTNRSFGRTILRLPVERIVVPLMSIMQKATQQPQKLHCLPKLLIFGSGTVDVSAPGTLILLRAYPLQRRKPPTYMYITQAART